MSKALRIKIISYLREQDAIAKYVDIRGHVLNDKDSVEERNELKATLDYLSNKRLVAVNGSYEFLHWTVSYGLYNLNNKVIATKLTKVGQLYHPEEESDDLEVTVPPVLAVIKKGPKAKTDSLPEPDSHVLTEEVAMPTPVATEPEPLPWYVAPVAPEPVKVVEPEPQLPWYTEPTVPEAEKAAEIEPQLPWYVEPTPPIVEKAADPEPQLPWYTEPAAHEQEKSPEPALPWYVAPVEPEAEKTTPDETQLPRQIEARHDEHDVFEAEMLTDSAEIKREELQEPKPATPDKPVIQPSGSPVHDVLKGLDEYVPLQPWYIESQKYEQPKAEHVVTPEPAIQEPVAQLAEPVVPLPWDADTDDRDKDTPEPVIYRFPPLELKPEPIVKTASPMVIERINENLSNSIDAISNIKIKRPNMLTGDFERDSDVIMKFVLVIVLFLLFGCIVWLYMG